MATCFALVWSQWFEEKHPPLRLLDGLYLPTQGAIHAFSRDLSEDALRDKAPKHAFRRRAGFVFQDPDVQLFAAYMLDEVTIAPLQVGLSAEVEARLE